MKCKLDHSDPDVIPEFLCAYCHPEKWRPPLHATTCEPVDPVMERQRELREMQEARRKSKRTESLKKHLDAHQFERWDAKAKEWVRDDDKINAHHAALEAEPVEET